MKVVKNAIKAKKNAQSKAGPKKKEPVTKKKSLATTFSQLSSLGSVHEPSNKPSKNAGEKKGKVEEASSSSSDTEVEMEDFLHFSLNKDIRDVSRYNKELAGSLKVKVSHILRKGFPWGMW